MMKLKLSNNYLDNWIKVNWIKVDRAVCSAIEENIYAIVEVINPMTNVQCYDALIDFIGHYLKKDRQKYTEWVEKKDDMFGQVLLNTSLMNEINFLVIIIIIVVIINITNIDSGSIYKYNGSSPYKRKKI